MLKEKSESSLFAPVHMVVVVAFLEANTKATPDRVVRDYRLCLFTFDRFYWLWCGLVGKFVQFFQGSLGECITDLTNDWCVLDHLTRDVEWNVFAVHNTTHKA